MKGLNNSTILAALCLLAVSGSACTPPAPSTPADTAKRFVVALNKKDVKTLANLSANPLWVRRQDWETARDGAGFVLGTATDANLTNADEIKRYFSDSKNAIAVEDEAPGDASLALLQEELRGSEKRWSGLSMFIFRRGTGDVEHTFAVGVNDKAKVSTVYLN